MNTPLTATPVFTPARRRQALAAISLGTALSLLGDAALYAILPSHTAEAGVALASVGVLLSANRWVRLVFNGVAGHLYDRWPRRPFFLGALWLGVLAMALGAFTQGFWPLFAGRVLWGIAWSGIWVGGNTIVLDLASDADRGRWTGLYQLSFYLGTSLGAALGGALTDALGYHSALQIATAGMALGAGLAVALLPETRGARTPEAANAPTPAAAEARPQLAGLGRDPLAPVNALYMTNRFVIAGLISTTLSLLIQERWEPVIWPGLNTALGAATLTGGLLAVSTLVSLAAAPLAGQASDRVGQRWRVAAAALLPGLLGLALLIFGPPLAIVPGVLLTAIAGGSSQSLSTAMLGDYAGERRGRALGWMHTFGDLSSAAAPMLAYALLPWIGLAGVYGLGLAAVAGMWVWAARLAAR